LSTLDTAVQAHFAGPANSPFMECDYRPRDADRFRLKSEEVEQRTAGEQEGDEDAAGKPYRQAKYVDEGSILLASANATDEQRSF